MGSQTKRCVNICRMSQGPQCHLNVVGLFICFLVTSVLRETLQVIMAHFNKTVAGQRANNTEPIIAHTQHYSYYQISKTNTSPLTKWVKHVGISCPDKPTPLSHVMLCYPFSQTWFFFHLPQYKWQNILCHLGSFSIICTRHDHLHSSQL